MGGIEAGEHRGRVRRTAWALVIVLTYLAVLVASAACVIRGIIVLANGFVGHGIAWIALGATGLILIVLLLVTVFTLVARSVYDTPVRAVQALDASVGDQPDQEP